ncbi:hypothetical protein AgCh_003232 [Apium graveolens]
MNIAELFVFNKKVITTGRRENEIFRDMIKGFIKGVSPQAFTIPFVVKYFSDNRLQNMTLSEENLERTRVDWMRFIEANLRCRGSRRTDADVAAAEFLYAYRLNYTLKETSEREMRKQVREYAHGVFIDGVDESTLMVDSPAVIVEHEGELAFKVNDKKVKLSNFSRSGSEYIRKAINQVKASTCKEDKKAIAPDGKKHKSKQAGHKAVMDNEATKKSNGWE